MKKYGMKRLLSLALALVLVAGTLPVSVFAAAEVTDFPSEELPFIAYSDGVTQYFKCNNYLYQVKYTNLKTEIISTVSLGALINNNLRLRLKRGSHATFRDVHTINDLPKTQGNTLYCYNSNYYAINYKNPTTIITCIAVNEPVWTWNGTSSATAKFTAADNADVFATAKATISSETVVPAESCQKREQAKYTATVTFNGQTYTDTKIADGEAGPHSYAYFVSGNTLTQTCALGCGHTATATLTAEDSVYTGSAITTASITYSENWLGNKADASAISYGDNVNAGVVDVSANIQANDLLTHFTIQRADITGATVTLAPAQTQYTGAPQEPDISVVWNGMTLTEDRDYTVSWDKTGLTEAGTYTATIAGMGNFTGAVEKTYTIQPANFGGMMAKQIGTLTYNKTAQIPQVEISAVAVNDQPITITYSTRYEGPFGSMPGVTDAGTHIIYYKLSAPNHNDEIGQVRIYVDYGIPVHTPPVAKELTYDGTEQALIIEGSVEDGQMLYGFDQIDYFPQIPTKTEAGEYTVHYVIPASMHYAVVRGTVTVQIKKADQDAPTVGKTDETISKKCDGAITGVDETMEYRAEGADTYTAITGNTVTGLAAGTYYVRCKGDSNHNPSADTAVTIAPGRKLKLTLPQQTTGYTLTASAEELDWAEMLTITLDIDQGYAKTDSFAFLVNGVDRTSLLLSGAVYIDIGVTKDTTIQVTGIADITPPTANIAVKDNSWTAFWNDITFGLFFNQTQQVTITAEDPGAGVDKVYYYLSDCELEPDEVKNAVADWQEYNGAFQIDPDKVCVIYAKVTDKAGNAVYLNSDGIVLDATAPVISGAEEGQTYYTSQKVTVTETNLAQVTLNGVPVTGEVTLEGNKDAVYTVVATDKAGNATTLTVTMKPIATMLEGYTEETLTAGDKKPLQDIQKAAEGLLADANSTEEEKAALAEVADQADALLKTLKERIPQTGDRGIWLPLLTLALSLAGMGVAICLRRKRA